MTTEEQPRQLEQDNRHLKEQLAQGDELIERLTQRLAALEEQLRKNSRTSSLPPSSDRFVRQPRSLRKKICLYLHIKAHHPVVSAEDSFPAGGHGPLCACRRAGSFCGLAGLRLSTSHHHEVAHSRWRARSDVVQAVLLPSAAPTHPAGRTAHPAAERQTDPSFCGWPLILARRFSRCSSSVPAPNTWLIHTLRESLAPGCLPLFTSDGLNLYFCALTAHFGQWLQLGRQGRQVRRWQVEPNLIYGQVKKCYRRRKLVRVSHVMRLGTQADLTVALQRLSFSGRLNTAFIERVNLTVRHGIAALAHRTWATAQLSPQLLAHLEWWRAYYHFVRPHESLRVSLVQPRERGGKRLAQRYQQRTPAMAAGRTKRRWTAREVLSCPLPPLSA